MSTSQYRYPGPRSFTKEDRLLFVGRESDIEQLENLIELKKITVVFGKSGTGKSSLLNAGVIPELEKTQTYAVTPVRFFFRGDVLLPKEETGNYLVNIIKENFPITQPVLAELVPFQSNSLWWHFKQLQFQDKNSKSYLLIIDQFEELGSYKPDQVVAFLKDLNELLNYPITPEFRKVLFEQLEKKTTLFNEDEIELLHLPVGFKLVLIIKSEKLGLLHSVKKYISDILQNCYELNPLTEEQAIRAIREPAEIDLVNSVTPKFAFDKKAVDAILHYLLGKTDFTFYDSPGIQTSFLQMICCQIEQEIVPKIKERVKPPSPIVIEKEDIGSIDKLAENYYNKKIEILVSNRIMALKEQSKLDEKQAKDHEAKYENIIKNFLEVELIMQQGDSYFRKQIFEDSFPSAYDLLKENDFEILRQLIDYGILRKDKRIEAQELRVFYEISHEKLLVPILKSRNKLKTIEEEEKTKVDRENKQTSGARLESMFQDSQSGQAQATDGDSYSFLRKANELSYAGKYHEAIEYFDKSIEKNPDYFHTYYLRASNFLNAGQFEKAIEDFNTTLKLNPEYYESYNEIGRCYLQLKNYTLAFENFKKVTTKNKSADYAWYNLGLTRFYQKYYEQAIEYFSIALGYNPDYGNCYIQRGLCYGILKRFDEAFADFEKAEKLEPNSYLPFYGKGICYYQIGEDMERTAARKSSTEAADFFRRSIEQLSKSLSLYPDDNVAAYYRALSYEKIKDYNNALLDYTQLTKKDPSYVDAWYGKGATNYSLKNYKEAITDFSKVVDLDPNYTNAYYERGRSYYELKKYEEAIEDFNEVLRLKRNDSEAFLQRGVSYAALRDYQSAISSFDSALEIDKDYIDAYFERGLAYFRLGDYQTALQDYSEVIKRKSDYHEAYYNKGLCYFYLHQHTKAIEEFTKLLQIKKNYTNAYYQRALSRETLKQYKLAIDDYTQVISLEKKPYDAYYGRGYCKYDLGDYEEALKDFNKVLELRPSYPQLHLTMGAAYFRLHDYKKALEETNLELISNPDSAIAYCNRADIHRRMGNPELAMADVHKAAAIDPNDAYPHAITAFIAFDSGDIENFYSNLEIAVDKGYPLFREIKDMPELKKVAKEKHFKDLVASSEMFSKSSTLS